jgi:hypothetical protein
MKELIVYEPTFEVVKRKKTNLFKVLFNIFWLPLKYTIFGLRLQFYVENVVKCSVITGAFIALIHYKYGITHWDGVYLIAMNNLIYPYAKFLFPSKGRFKHYADEGVTVTMTRMEYDRSLLINTVVPYFFAFIFAPIGLLVLLINNLRR